MTILSQNSSSLSSTYLGVLVGLMLIGGISRADTLCDVVLTSKAFNISDYESSSKVFQLKKDDVCRSEYSSAQEAVSSAEQAGGSIGYGPFSLGASDAKQTSSGKYSIADSRFCQAKAEELDSFTSIRAKQQVTDLALKAWSKCIQTTQTNKIYLEYTENYDGSGITGSLIRYLSGDGGAGSIKGISTSNPENKISCKIGTKTIKVDEEFDIPINKGRTNFSCVKQPNISAKISFITSEGDREWIDLPSKKEHDQTTIDKINAAVNELCRKLAQATFPGTISAFNLASCPEGWKPFEKAAGRVIVTVGQGAGLSPRRFLDTGGEEKHLLTTPEMPRHKHQLPTFNGAGGSHEVGSGHFGFDWVPVEYSLEEGGDQPHNIMQPFIVLTTCEKQ